MTRADVVRSLRECAGGEWISARRLREWLCSGDRARDVIVEGLSYRLQGTRKLYFVPDVAASVMLQVVRRES